MTVTKKFKIKANNLMTIIWKHFRNKIDNSSRSSLSYLEIVRKIIDLRKTERTERVKKNFWIFFINIDVWVIYSHERHGCVKNKVCSLDLNTLGIRRQRQPHCPDAPGVWAQRVAPAAGAALCNSPTAGPPNYIFLDIVSFFFLPLPNFIAKKYGPHPNFWGLCG